MTAARTPTAPAARPTRPPLPHQPLLRALPAPTQEETTKPRQRTRRTRVVVAACAAIGLGLFANVAFTAVTARTQFRLEHLERRADEAEARYQRRRLEVATLEAPRRIVDEAHRLGMVQPAKVTYLAPTPETTATDTAPQAPSGDEGEPSWAEVKPHLTGGG